MPFPPLPRTPMPEPETFELRINYNDSSMQFEVFSTFDYEKTVFFPLELSQKEIVTKSSKVYSAAYLTGSKLEFTVKQDTEDNYKNDIYVLPIPIKSCHTELKNESVRIIIKKLTKTCN